MKLRIYFAYGNFPLSKWCLKQQSYMSDITESNSKINIFRKNTPSILLKMNANSAGISMASSGWYT